MIRALFDVIKQSRYVLGLNARNLQFLRPLNLKQARHVADNKLLTKKTLETSGIAVPKTFAIIGSGEHLRKFNPEDLPKSFVLKPNRGLGGEGIVLTYNKKREGVWLDNELKEISWNDIRSHVQDILDGRFSLANMPDIAFFEERLVRESMFKRLVYRGVPDIRVIVYNRVPIMAMMRFPTRESRGKANLHLGSIGVGVDIARGVTTYSICRDRVLTDRVGVEYRGIRIPDWERILELAITAQEATGLGYIGVDIVLAKRRGPVVLEVNARPGLSIQLANMAGLKERLYRVRGLVVESAERGIRLAKELFGEPERGERVLLPDSRVINVIETIVLFHVSDSTSKMPIKVKVDSGAFSSSMDYELARKMGYGEVVDYIKQFQLDTPMREHEAKRLKKKVKKALKSHPWIQEVTVVHSASGSTIRVTVPVRFKLKDTVIASVANLISREHLLYDMIIGRRDLRGFLIQPRK